jgi:hypothetical protein
LVWLLPLYKGAGTTCHPLAPNGFGETEIVGVYRERCTTFGTSTSQRRLGRVIHLPQTLLLTKFEANRLKSFCRP